MRPMLRKLLSAALAAVMLASPLTAYASDALGHDLTARDIALNTGTALADGTFWSDTHADLRQENYVVYTPNERVTPMVTYGETTRALTTVTEAAQALEDQGWRVVAGINGDYYGTAHGVPLGSTMVDGELRNMNGDPYYAVGFRADGTAIIGDPQLHMHTLVGGGSGFDVFAFNHVRQSEYGVFLYDSRFNNRGTTGTSEPGVDVVCSVADGALTIGGTMTLVVDEVLPEATDTAVEAGKYILTANRKAYDAYTAPLLALQPGDEVTIQVTSGAGEEWNDVVNLIGAPELLVENGAVVSGLPAGSAPRTAIGQKADGSIVFYTIDGRQSGYSIGASLTAVAMRLVELGCVTAVALDGGGSTTLVATMPYSTGAGVVNTPSEGGVRAVSNHVFLVAPNQPSGVLDHIYLSPIGTKALPGAQVALTANAIDTNYIPMSARITLRADKGTVSGNMLSLPAATGTVTATASYNGKSASAKVEVMEPERIVVRRNGTAVTSLTLAPNSDAALTAQGIVKHLPLVGDNSCFNWSFEGNSITFDPEFQTLRAGGDAGVGTLTVSLGDKSVSIPVTVAIVPLQLLDDFETAFEPVTDVVLPAEGEEAPTGIPEPRLTLSRATDAAHVHNGKASARLDYALDGENAATLPLNFAIPSSDYTHLEFWTYGSGGDATLSVETDTGVSPSYGLGDGWTRCSVILPPNSRTVTGLRLSADSAESGTIWLDQLTLAYGRHDETAPEVTLTLDAETNTLTGRAFDALNGTTLPTLRLAFDGKALAYSYDKRTGALSAALPAYDGLAHYVTLTAGDAAGNLARASVYIPAAAELAPVFPDLAGHWSAGAAEYLWREGVTNGSDGLYKPDTNITRQEFATMLYRWLKPAEDYSGVEMPFADTNQIAPWAMDAAKAMYTLGVIGGMPSDAGIAFKPSLTLTRQEAATMLGRLFEQGYAVPELSYADTADIAGWAAPHVALLGSIGALDDFVTDAFAPAAPLTRAEMASMLLRIN